MPPKQTITLLSVQQLTAHPDNIRDELGDLTEMAKSIREHGILQPLTVTEHSTRAGVWVVLDGHRRLAAALLANQLRVPAIIRHGVSDPAEQTIVMLVTATHRRDLQPVERAQAYGALRNRGLTLSDIARRTGVHISTVSYYLNLLDLDEESLEKVEAGDIPSGAAIAAVREQRQQQRESNGRARRGRTLNRVHYFGPTHPLASRARQACAAQHQKLGGNIACPRCWEKTIREDQRALDVADSPADSRIGGGL
jgi:ParB family chromosome partitioning protein